MLLYIYSMFLQLNNRNKEENIEENQLQENPDLKDKN
jgi:hypothetical protein